MSEPDFEEQLRQEKLETAKRELGDDGSYVDPDGTEYEWNAQKKAWFPKIDDDFIAQYQLNYGQDLTAEKEEKEEKEDEVEHDEHDEEKVEEKDERSEEEKQKDHEEYEKHCREYYDYYYGDKSTKKEGGDGKGDNSEYTFEDYMAYCRYYGGQSSTEGQEGEKKEEKKKEGKKAKNGKSEKMDESDEPKPGEKRKPNREEGWFDHSNEGTAHVYVSGLPLDITDDEYQELMSKYGLIMFDPATRKPKLKLYRDESGEPKGDGLCCFIKQESVDLALHLLDGLEVRGHKISVERAQFEMKGQYDPAKKKKKLSNKAKRKLKERQEKLFDWSLGKQEGRQKHEKTVVLKNMFDPNEFEENPVLINELRDDVRLEVTKFGEVKKVEVYDRHQDGVITVRFKELEEADACITQLHGRWFAKRRIIAQTWDGKSKYEVEETEAERDARLKKWEVFLEKGAQNSGASSNAPSATPDVTSSSTPDVASSTANVVPSVPNATESSSAVESSNSTMASSVSVEMPSKVGSDDVSQAEGSSATPPASPSATPPASPSATPPASPSATPPASPSATPPASPSATPPASPSATPPASPADHPETDS